MRPTRGKTHYPVQLKPSLSDGLFMVREKSSKNNKVKQYKEWGHYRTETGGADQTFHASTKVSDTQELHCSQRIRKQKEPKSGWIKSHYKSEAQL